jgi:NAD+ kinase
VKPLSTVLLLADPRAPRVGAERRRLQRWLEERDVRVLVAPLRPALRAAGEADLVVVLGGDGTFLRAARAVGGRDVPIVGIRFGTFGYLAELEPGKWEPGLARLLGGGGTVESWLRLRCRIHPPRGRVRELGTALNEVVVTASRVAHLVDVNLKIDGEQVTRYRGDGMIVATPVGSTAYSLSAGGPIVDRTDRCLLITPLASHALTYRPLVLRANRKIELEVVKARHGTALTIDGQQTVPLREGTLVEVREAEQDLRVASVVERTRFRTIRERLRWGAPLTNGP